MMDTSVAVTVTPLAPATIDPPEMLASVLLPISLLTMEAPAATP